MQNWKICTLQHWRSPDTESVQSRRSVAQGNTLSVAMVLTLGDGQMWCATIYSPRRRSADPEPQTHPGRSRLVPDETLSWGRRRWAGPPADPGAWLALPRPCPAAAQRVDAWPILTP